MAVIFRASSSASRDSFGAGSDLAAPVGTLAGDVLVAVVVLRGSSAHPTPSGWTLVVDYGQNANGGSHATVFRRVATGTDPAVPLVANTAGVMAAYSGVDPTAPVEAHAGDAGTNLTNITAPSVPVSRDGARVISIFSGGSVGWTPQTGTGMVVRHTLDTDAPGLAFADAQQGVGSSLYQSAASSDGSMAGAWATATVALKPGNNPPNAPVLTAPADGSTLDRNSTQRFDWDFSDPDTGDSQSKYDLRYRLANVAKNEIQDVTISGSPTGGTFTLTYSGQTTAAIAYNATAATVQTELEALSNIGVGDVAVTGAAGGPWTVTFQGALGATDVAQMTATSSLTGGTTPGVTVATTQQGVPYPAWTDVTGSTPNTFHDFAAATFAAGDYEWQVRTYDAQGVVGPYTASAFFTAATPTGVPTITAPTSGGTVGTNPATVTWSTAGGQDAYQVRRVADNAGAADEATVYYDSGEVTSTTARAHSTPFETNNRYEHIQVRVKLAGLWSSWASIRVLVSYTPPAEPQVNVIVEDESGSIYLDITNPTPGVGEPAVSYNDVHVDDGDGFERRATFVTTNGAWRYWTPISGRDYGGRLRVVAVGDNGTTATHTVPENVTVIDGSGVDSDVIDGGTP